MIASASSPLPTTRAGWHDLLLRLGVRPSKGLGQHFLFERGITDRLVRAAELSPADLVVEVGPGLGILTESLLQHGTRVYAIELDRRLAAHLRDTFSEWETLEVVEANALEVDVDQLLPTDQPFDVAANLPYASGTAILRHLLEQPRRPRRLTVMMQREVAERIAAEPPEMSILAVATRFYARSQVAFLVAPSVFIPPPSVESAVLVLDVRADLPLQGDQSGLFFQIVNAGFSQKRKQLANTLAAGLSLTKSDAIDWLTAAGMTPDRRPQTLRLEDWLNLTKRAPPGLGP